MKKLVNIFTTVVDRFSFQRELTAVLYGGLKIPSGGVPKLTKRKTFGRPSAMAENWPSVV